MRKLILSVIILFVGVKGYAKTYQEVINTVRTQIGDTGPTSDEYYFSDVDMVNAINTVEEEIIAYSKPREFRKVYKTTTTTGKSLYDMPDDIIGVPKRVGYYIVNSTSAFEKLSYTTIPKLDKEYENWEDKPLSKPDSYYIKGDQIGLYPAPGTRYSTSSWKCMKIDYTYNPVDISTSNLSDTIFDGNKSLSPFSKVLELGVKAQLQGRGVKSYYSLLSNMRNIIKRRMDFFNNDGTFYRGGD